MTPLQQDQPNTVSPLVDAPPRRSPVLGGFKLVEHGLLILIAMMTAVAAGMEIWRVYINQSVTLADILLMFLYLEVIGMTAAFYEGGGAPLVYPIFIAITAIARLIVLQGKDMSPSNVIFEAGAILVLSVAALIVGYASRSPVARRSR